MTISTDKTSVEIKWCPFIKGLYKVFFNGQLAKNYELCVIANQVAKANCKIETPELKSIGFYEKFNIIFEYRLFLSFNNLKIAIIYYKKRSIRQYIRRIGKEAD